MQKLVFINGSGNEIDLTSGNFGITNWAGLSNVPLNIQTQQVPFEDGGVYLDALMNQRDISVTVAIYDGNNLELRYQKKRELISALNPKLGEGTLIYTNDYLSKQIKAVPQIPLFQNKNSNDAGTLKATVSFTCPSPYWEDVEETEVNINEAKEIEVTNTGDVPAQIKGTINASGGNLSLINYTNGKKLILLNSGSNEIYFDTNIGKKKIEKQDKVIEFLEGGSYNSILNYEDKLYLVGNALIRMDINYNIETYSIEENTPILDITYSKELGMFAICGGSSNDGYIYISYDGKKWTKATIPNIKNLQIISYEDGKFKAQGYINYNVAYITSLDGVNWQAESVTISKTKDKIFINNIYIRVYNNTIQTSRDNTNWTTVYTITNPDYSSILKFNSLCYFAGNYYFCGSLGLLVKSTNLVLFEVIRYLPSNSIDFMVKSANKLYGAPNTGNSFFISETGYNWIAKTTPQINRDVKSLCYGKGVIVISYDLGTQFSSVDEGDNWQSITITGFDSEIAILFFYIDEYFYATDGRHISISEDGINYDNYGTVTFEKNSNTHTLEKIFNIVNFNNEFYVFGYDNNDRQFTIVKTTDFSVYNYVYSDYVDDQEFLEKKSVESNENIIMFCYGKILYKTDNGADWTKINLSSYFLQYESRIESLKVLNNEY